METKDLIEAYILTGQKIDVLWNFFVTVHLAIAGLLLFTDSERVYTPNLAVIIFLLLGYSGFSCINWRAKDLEYDLLNALTVEITSRDTQSVALNSFYNMQDYSDRSLINIVVHIFSLFLIIVLYRYHYSKSSTINHGNKVG